MHSKVLKECDLASIDIDFYNWNMDSMAHNGVEHTKVLAIFTGGSCKGMIIGEASLQAALHICRQVEFEPVGLEANICDAQRTIGALDPDTAFSNLHIFYTGLQKMRSDLAHLLFDFHGCTSYRS